METKINKISNFEIELELEVPSENLSQFIEKATLQMGKDLEVDGFRKGKAPKEVVEKHFGKEIILSEAAAMALQDKFREAVLEHDLEVISQPEANIVKLEEGSPFIFKIKAQVLPEINLPDYKNIAKKVKKEEVKVEEKEIEEAMKWVQKSRANLTAKNGPAEKGDFIEIEYSLPNYPEQKDGFILGEGKFFPGFEDSLIGMKSGEEKKGVKIKDNNKEILVDIRVKSVQKMELPELNDEFIKSLGGSFKDLSEARKSIREGLTAEKEGAEIQKMRANILEKIREASSFEIPPILLEREQKTMLESFKNKISETLKISFEEYLEKMKKNEKDIVDSFKEEAEKKIKNVLILREIKKKEDITASEEEIKEEADKILKTYKTSDQTGLDPEKLKAYTEEVVLNEKVFKLLENFTKK